MPKEPTWWVWLITALLLAIGLAGWPGFFLAAMALCPGLTLTAPIHPSLSANETRLICGDKSNTGGKSEGWNQVPMNQAPFALKKALQSRGYLSPSATQSASTVSVRLFVATSAFTGPLNSIPLSAVLPGTPTVTVTSASGCASGHAIVSLGIQRCETDIVDGRGSCVLRVVGTKFAGGRAGSSGDGIHAASESATAFVRIR